jgi:hypothetical protein
MTDKEQQQKHKRWHVQEDPFVILKPYGSKVGRLIDISIEGLTFEYLATGEPLSRPTELHVVMPESRSVLYGIPCKIISHHRTFESPLASMTMRRCTVQFGDLSPSQVSQLKDLIQHHTVGDATQDDILNSILKEQLPSK